MDNLVWVVFAIDTLLGAKLEVLLLIFMAMSIMGAILGRVGDEVGEFLNLTFNKRWIHVVMLTLLCMQIALPSKETAYKMLAVYAGVELLQTDGAKKLSSKSLDVLNKVMDDYLVEGG